jgi:predicted permease
MAGYRTLLRLLPRDRRRRHGDEMAQVFAELAETRRATSGRLAVGQLWVAEIAGLLRFSLREWATRAVHAVSSALEALGFGGHDGPGPFGELGWAWRGLLNRGWRGVLVVGLLALALGANAIVFAAADSFVFHRVPYRDADRLVELGAQRQGPFGWRSSVWPELVPVWRRQTDLFADMQAYTAGGSVYLSGGDEPRFVWAEAVTPGLLEMLGARLLWGRSFTPHDVAPGADPVAIVAEDIAAQEFGDARHAVGQTIALQKPARIVGILPTVFRFPTGQERIWTPLNLESVPLHYLVRPIARLAPTMRMDVVSQAVSQRAPALTPMIRRENQQGLRGPVEARPIAPALVDPRLRRLFLLLTAATGCLLLVACANVVNLELGAAVGRTRVLAISMALGAGRATLIRIALLEGALVLGIAAAFATLLTWQVTTYIATHLPTAMTVALPNPIHVDIRTLWVMLAVAAATWLVASLPVAVLASRTDVLDALRLDGRTLSTSRAGARVRQALTVGEVALTVLLLVGASLNVRTYRNLLNLPKGFDEANVIAVDVRQRPVPAETDAMLQTRLLAALRTRPDVVAATVADASPPSMGASIGGPLTIGSDPESRGQVALAGVVTGPEYFRVLRLPLISGRAFATGDPAEDVVIDETFARRYWPDSGAVGAVFNLGGASFGGRPQMTVIGVARHLRTDQDSVTEPSDSHFAIYLQGQPSDSYVPLSFVIRLTDGASVDSLHAMLRALAPTTRVRVQRMTDRYAATFADEQLASAIMSAFGVLAFLVATAGVYGVMAFFVVARTREMGIRLALGADRGAVRRLIVTSSMRPVLAGTVIGVTGAVIATHWARSLYFGVAAVTPATFVLVALLVIATSALATWPPARQAGRVDPSRLLRD